MNASVLSLGCAFGGVAGRDADGVCDMSGRRRWTHGLVDCAAHDDVFLVEGLLQSLEGARTVHAPERHRGTGTRLRILAPSKKSFAVEDVVEVRNAGLPAKRAIALEERHFFPQIGIADRPAFHRRLET